ncbi:hypothetical protein GCM10009789_10150 [Kribbella sancticallisti]|uniref:Uncharacterized protein n=1 Tax=Kribbella sancticallisti TaxID=460087 RepID=A0ABN2CHH4_9ACTN
MGTSKRRARWRGPLEPDATLALWADFPVEARPRPIVLTSRTGGSGGGFASWEAKEAYSQAPMVSDVELPPGLMEVLRPYPKPHWQGEPIHVRSIRGVTREFGTDRGHRPLPAYELEIQYAPGPVCLLDPEIDAITWWPPDLDLGIRGLWTGLPVVMTHNELTLSQVVIGSPPVYSDVRVTAVLETTTAVLVLTEETMHEGFDSVPLVAVDRPITAHLAAPLGNRVLINASGQPLTVLHG